MSTFVFNFMKQFAADVEQLKKRQTIRANRRDGKRPVPGDTAKLYTGLRTSHARLLGEHQVLRVHGVRMCFGLRMGNASLPHHHDELVVDGVLLNGAEREAFARDDGFKDWAAMRTWFFEQHGREGHDFEGFCVEW